jgi:hypothetical protein
MRGDSLAITNESREAAPRPRHHGVLNRTHTRASSLAKMSAGIPNPCGYIDQPARARLGRMVTAGPPCPTWPDGDRWPQLNTSRPAEQSLRLSHNTKSQAPKRIVKAKAHAGDGGRRAGDATPAMRRRRAFQPASPAEQPAMRRRRCVAGDGLAEAPQTAVDHRRVAM